MRRTLLTSVSAIIVLGLASPALSQTTGTPPPPDADQAEVEAQGGIADIVVTAQRREESVQDVPIAISAFSAEQLSAQGVGNTLQLANFVPNLFAMNNTGLGSANSYYLRGLGNTETIATFDPPVGTYVDDIYISRQNANNLSLFDVARVEVLRGPQGTLFGRNTTGGAINLIMREPGDEFAGFAEVGYGRFEKKLVRASVDLPLAPTFAVKVSGYFQDDIGYARNITTGERVNDDDGWGVRLGLRGDLSDTVRWNASYLHAVSEAENLLNFQCNPGNPNDCKGRFVTTGLTEGNEPNKLGPVFRFGPMGPMPASITGRKANYGLGNKAASDIIASNLQFELNDALTLNLITGYVNVSQQFALDFADGRGLPTLAVPNPPVRGFALGGFSITNDGQHEQFTQEVKLNGSLANGFVDFVGGVFYINERNTTDFADIFTLGIVPGGLPLLLADRTLFNKTEAWAGYFQADFNVTDQLKLTAGIRYTDEEKTVRLRDNRASCRDGSIEPTCLDNANFVAASGAVIPDRQNEKIWTPRFAINFTPNDDLLFFTSATRGFKSGGWNARATAPGAFLPFGPEKVWSYEAGLKSDLFDRRVRANITAFYLDVSGLQTPSALIAPNGTVSFITRNFADYRNYGLEGEFTFQPTDELNLFANIGWQDDEYRISSNAPALDEFGIQSVAAQQASCRQQLAAGNVPTGLPPIAACGVGIIDEAGNIATPVRTPRWTVSFGATYELPLGNDGMTLVPSANARWQSRSETGTANYSIFAGPSSGANGSFPSNPFGGDFITGSLSPSNWLVNATLTLNGPDKRWALSAECVNCFNETVNQSSLVNYTYINPPMMWMVRGRMNF